MANDNTTRRYPTPSAWERLGEIEDRLNNGITLDQMPIYADDIRHLLKVAKTAHSVVVFFGPGGVRRELNSALNHLCDAFGVQGHELDKIPEKI